MPPSPNVQLQASADGATGAPEALCTVALSFAVVAVAVEDTVRAEAWTISGAPLAYTTSVMGAPVSVTSSRALASDPPRNGRM